MFELLCLFLTCDVGFYELYICPPNDCEEIMLQYLDEDYYCAFYDLRLNKIKNALDENKVLVDEDYYKDYGRKISMTGLQHNKFCTNGQITITGSFNPTENGKINKNLVIVINSKKIARNYLEEYEEIKLEHKYGKTKHETVHFKDFKLNNYFCPEDNCEEQVIKEIKQAKESIYFEQFSFTSKPIKEELIKKHLQGIKINGIFDKLSAKTKWSIFKELNQTGMNVTIWKGEGKLHNKIFIIDNETYIVGSYNPTKNGNEKNDENIVIIS